MYELYPAKQSKGKQLAMAEGSSSRINRFIWRAVGELEKAADLTPHSFIPDRIFLPFPPKNSDLLLYYF
jgi:hypothetical protein